MSVNEHVEGSPALGTTSVCSLDAKPLRAVTTWLHHYEAFWRASMQSLKRYVRNNDESHPRHIS
jgi:hypothetical protein